MEKKTTIYDIAQKLGITAATVSRALNNSARISKATKELVQKTALEMNYELNQVARALKSGKSYNIGVIIPRIDSNFFSSIIRGIEEELRPYGYHVIICQTHEDPIVEKECIDTLLNAQVDGILLSTTSKSNLQNFDKTIEKGIPLIFFDRGTDLNNISSVTIDDFEGGYISTKHLIDQGYQNIAHLRGAHGVDIYDQRFLGYQQALLDAGYALNENYIMETHSSLEAGAEAANALLNLNERPDAIFSSSDFAALGALKELRAQGVQVPDEIGIVGFSNEPFTKFLEIPISSVDQSPIEMGRASAQVFTAHMNNDSKDKFTKEITLQPKLVVRKSSLKVTN